MDKLLRNYRAHTNKYICHIYTIYICHICAHGVCGYEHLEGSSLPIGNVMEMESSRRVEARLHSLGMLGMGGN